jgi:hypothetical protein
MNASKHLLSCVLSPLIELVFSRRRFTLQLLDIIIEWLPIKRIKAKQPISTTG